MRKLLLAGVFNLALIGVVYGQTDSIRVSNVVVEGNKKTDATALQLQLEAKAGTIARSSIDKDIKTLFGLGFFEQVQAVITQDDKGRSILKYKLVEKPVVRKVFIKGNKAVDNEDIEQVLDFRSGRFFDLLQVKRAEERISSYYQGRGFFDAAAAHSIVPVGSNQIDVTFSVDEGDKYKISTISFEGVTVLDEDDLASKIQTKEYSWWSSWIMGTGRLNREMLDNDRNILRQELVNHGLLEGSVSEPVIKKEDKRLYITFNINEGPQYKIDQVSASGDLIDESQEKTISGVELEKGDVFNGSKLRADSLVISDKFSDIGYAFVNVVPDTRLNKVDQTVSVDFKISKGNLITVDRINFRGNNKTYDNVLRRDMDIAEQDLYSSSKVRRSQELLQRRGYFEEVNIVNENTSAEDKIDLGVNVKEGSTGTFSIGAGYSSSDGAIFNTRLSENNVFGTGRRANLEVDIGDERDNIVVSFSDPRIFDTQWSLGLDLLKTNREYDDFDRGQAGAGLTAGYDMEELFGRWARDMRFSLRYQLVETEIDNVNLLDAADLVIASQGKSTVSSFTPSITRNTINNPLDPTSGSKQTLSFEYAGLGGDEEFILGEFVNHWYYPLIDLETSDIVFSLRTRFGYGESLNDDPFPLFERYFPGGINSVRGFKTRRLGPKDSKGNEFGGSKQLVNNMEFIFPLASSAGLKGILFYDFGQAFDDDENIEVSKLRHAVGYGFRWASPLGPIRIEFGYPLDREEGESSFVTLFSFGAPL